MQVFTGCIVALDLVTLYGMAAKEIFWQDFKLQIDTNYLVELDFFDFDWIEGSFLADRCREM